ncbi:hypothetical protein PtA15_16A175 [Puccinia triticina]|uniref:Uncharacterized protein n=1 Tax=Puccinia triticina TaxID=208348 RepID=A0ABY7D3T2_9BASI|nr:uncharacterized protein PtA15_16A175 [Puccinia triticina]WAQ92269.1 hypothetical protein PtA15_16A175 [Puccinia triticina]
MPLHTHSHSTNSRQLKPYHRNSLNHNHNNTHSLNHQLHQVELGIVSGSPLNPTSSTSQQQPPQAQAQAHDSLHQTKSKAGLLTKCVDWLFRNPNSKKQAPENHALPQPQQPPAKKQTLPSAASSTLITSRQTIHQPSLFANNSTNYNSLPSHNHNSNNYRQRPTQTQTQTQTSNDWFRSQSPFSERRRPNTSHATLNIPLSTNSSLSNRVFAQHQTIHGHQSRIRSLSPLRQTNAYRNTLSPSAQLAQSSTFSSLGRRPSPNRILNSTFLDNIPNSPRTSNGAMLSQKREHDQMSISPVRENSPPERSSVFGDAGSQSSKRQMFWDPNLGFVTKEQREKMMREAELKLREKEGRPLPTNEAEKILEILESGRNPHSLWGTKRYTANLPSIPVPTPSTASSQRTSMLKHLNRPSAPGTSLTAIYEEQALQSNHGTIIAPFNKKLEAERIKRLEEKKGQLRAELKKRKLFEENLHQRNRQSGEEDHQELNGSAPIDLPATDRAERKSSRRAQRSASAESAAEPARERVKSSRKIGKLTSSSSKAKVNQGRKSRSQSVNEEETNESTTAPPGRVTRSGRLLSNNAHDQSSKSSNSTRISKSLKNLKSPSPIQEEPEDHHQEPDSDNQSTQRDQPQVDQNSSCLHPTVRSASVSLQVPLSSMVKSTSSSSLRPGRTFSSRRHIKAKVFSAREEDLPPLNDGEDEEVDEESEKLKKIKLPSTFLSSFKLEKFNPPPPPPPVQVDVQPEKPDQPKQNPDSAEGSSLFKKSGTDFPKTSLFGAPPTAAPVPADPVPAAASTTSAPSISSQQPSFLSAPKESGEPVQQQNNKPSPFFSLAKDASTPVAPAPDKPVSSQQPPASSSGHSFSRISSDAPPPNFFGSVASQPTAAPDSSASKTAEQPAKPSPFSFQPSTTSTTTASTSNLFKPASESNSVAHTSLFGAQPTQNNESLTKPSESKSQPSLFSFGTQPSTQPTCSNDSVEAAPAPAPAPASSSVPTFSFGAPSSQAGSGFGAQAPVSAATSAPSQIAPAPASTPTFSFGAQPTTTTTSAQPANSQPPASNGMFDMMDSSSSTTAPSIFGNSAAAPSNPMPISTGFSFGSNLNTNNAVSAATKPAELNFGGTSSSTTPSFTFGASTNTSSGTTGPTQQPSAGGSLFGAPAPAPTSSSSSPFTFGAPSTTGTASASASPFVFGAANPSTPSPIPPTPGGSTFGLSSSNLATPTNNSSTNIFNFGAANATQQPAIANGNSTAGTSVFGAPSAASSSSAANNGAGGMFGMMSNNNNNAMNPGSGATTPSFSFGATTSGFGKPPSAASADVTAPGGLFGAGGGFGKPSPAAPIFGASVPANGAGGMDGKGSTTGMFGQPGSTGFGAPSTGAMDMNNGGQTMSIFGAPSTGQQPSSSAAASIFGAPSASAPSFSFSSQPSSTPAPPSTPFGAAPSSSAPTPGAGAPGGPTPGGFVFNMGSSTAKPSAPGATPGAGMGSAAGGALDGTPVRVTRKLPSSTRKPRR